MWDWLRKMSGEVDGPTATTPAAWVVDALGAPKRATYREDVRHLYGLLLSEDGDACRDVKDVGGVYDWRKVREGM